MNSHEEVRDLLAITIESVHQIITIPSRIQSPKSFANTVLQSEMGVLVGIAGDVSGRILMEGERQTFIKLGESLYGMSLSGEMFHSCIAEIMNMIAGRTSTIISEMGRYIDITPPIIMVGRVRMYGFEQGLSVTLDFKNVGQIHLSLLSSKPRSGV
ncbi:chemotaxis protein CheX [Paenibacillus sp. DS2015]|uniref:chemotaxis protein CheX n=1 Tax=Paenibacillus sp. DS2015 TaxID=3373917 RepID=UPI003D1EE7F4